MAPPTRVLHHPLSYHAPPFWTCNDQEPGGDGWSPVSQTRPFDLGICFERARVLPALQLAFVILASASVFHLRRQARQSENVAAGTRTSTLTRLALWAKIAALLVSIIVATASALIYKLPIDATLVLSHVASEVYSIERLRGLHERARTNIRPFRLATLHLLLGDGMVGYAKGAPYAGIIAAAGGEAVPEAWIEQLAVGGRIVAPTHSAAGGQALVVIDKTVTGLQRRILEAVHFVPLKSGIA